MSLAQEFVTKHFWSSAFQAGSYTTAGSPYLSLALAKPWEFGKVVNFFWKVESNTGGVAVTPEIHRSKNTDPATYTLWKQLPEITPVAAYFYVYRFDWEKMGLGDDGLDPAFGEKYENMKLRLVLSGGTSILMDGIWIFENLVRFPYQYSEYYIGEDTGGNPLVVRVDEEI